MKSSSLNPSISQRRLLKKFLPLSLSDVTMALGDPLQTIALSHLPNPQLNLAVVGIIKAFAVFLESPVIMMLHASTALSRDSASLKALRRFMLILAGTMTVLFLVPALVPFVYDWLLRDVFGATSQMAAHGHKLILMMSLWPAAIAWRRFYQGMLIRRGYNRQVGWASGLRIAWIALVLILGVRFASGALSGATLAGIAMAGGALVEALLVTIFTHRSEVQPKVLPASNQSLLPALPADLKGVAGFYFPLALTMLLVWGGRAAIISIIARAQDGALALAAWPASWGFVLVIANSTRMVQQLVISTEEVSRADLLRFTVKVGTACSVLIALLAFTVPGMKILSTLLGANPDLLESCVSVLRIAAIFPLLTSLQNALQGFLIRSGLNTRINQASFLSVCLTLTTTYALVRLGIAGASSAALGMAAGMGAELAMLFNFYRRS